MREECAKLAVKWGGVRVWWGGGRRSGVTDSTAWTPSLSLYLW